MYISFCLHFLKIEAAKIKSQYNVIYIVIAEYFTIITKLD